MIEKLIKKMQLSSTWKMHDLAKILATYNKEIGDEKIFKEILYSMVKNEILGATAHEWLGYSQANKGKNIKSDDFNYSIDPQKACIWAMEKSLKLPKEFNSLIGIDDQQEYGVVEPGAPLFATEFDIARQIQRKAVNQNVVPENMKSFIREELKQQAPKSSEQSINRFCTMLNPDSEKRGGRKKQQDLTS